MKCRNIRLIRRLPVGHWLGVVVAAVSMLPFFPCTFAHPHRNMSSVRVEVDVYSGRPNPTWDLAAAEAQSFIERWGALPALQGAIGGQNEPEGLGYRGLKVAVVSESHVRRIFVGRGKVIVEAPGSPGHRQLQDSGRRLEKWLLQTGREHLGPDLFQYLSHEAAKMAPES